MVMWVVVTLVLVVAPLALMAILRLAGAPGGRPGAAAIAGLTAGLLLGPLVGGRLLPDVWTDVYLGASPEREALRQLERRQMADRMALLEADVTGIALDEQIAAHEREREPLVTALAAAERAHRARFAWMASTLTGAWALGAGWLLGAHRRRLPRHPRVLADVAPLAAHMLVVAIIVLIAARPGVPLALLFGALLTMPGVSPLLRGPRLEAAWAGLLLTGVTTIVIGVRLGARVPPALMVPGAALLAGVGLGVATRGRPRRWARLAATALAAPIIAAITAGLDPTLLVRERLFWACALVALLLASDGRWVAYRFALRGRTPRPWTGAGDMINAGAAVLALVVGWLLWVCEVVPQTMLAGLLIGAIVVDLLRHVRRHLGRALDGVTDDSGEEREGV